MKATHVLAKCSLLLLAVYEQDQSYLQSIKAANKAASAAMMQLMLKDVDLSEVLQVHASCLQKYFQVYLQEANASFSYQSCILLRGSEPGHGKGEHLQPDSV